MNLICEDMSKANLLFMLYLILYGLAGLLFFPVVDKIGRQKSHWIFSTGHILAQALILFFPSFIARAIGFSLLGFMMVKNSLVYTWTFEFLLNDHKPIGISIVNILEFGNCIIAGVYFICISRDVTPLLNFLFGTGVIGYVSVSLLLPESPKWLLL